MVFSRGDHYRVIQRACNSLRCTLQRTLPTSSRSLRLVLRLSKKNELCALLPQNSPTFCRKWSACLKTELWWKKKKRTRDIRDLSAAGFLYVFAKIKDHLQYPFSTEKTAWCVKKKKNACYRRRDISKYSVENVLIRYDESIRYTRISACIKEVRMRQFSKTDDERTYPRRIAEIEAFIRAVRDKKILTRFLIRARVDTCDSENIAIAGEIINYRPKGEERGHFPSVHFYVRVWTENGAFDSRINLCSARKSDDVICGREFRRDAHRRAFPFSSCKWFVSNDPLGVRIVY